MKDSIKSMSDIAKAAGVSVMTVHRAIYNHPGVKAETKEKILKLVSKMNYRPNAYARAMRSGRFNNIGLATEQASIEMATVVGIFRSINHRGMGLTFAELPAYDGSNYFREEIVLPKLFAEHTIDGVIIHSSIRGHGFLNDWLRNSQIPFITLLSEEKYNSILPDYDQVMSGILSNSVDLGYKNLIYLGPLKAPGYHPSYYPLKIIKSWSLPKKFSLKYIATDTDIPEKEWYEQLRGTITGSSKITAIIGLYDEARRAYALAKELNLKIPEEISIICIGTRSYFADDGTAFSGFKYSNYELGELAGRMILEAIDKKQRIPSAKIKFKAVTGQTAPHEFFKFFKIKNKERKE